MPLNADLHCHSSHSDGVLGAAALVRRAAGNGVELLALTDHDELAGLAEARAEARRLGVRFVDGVEISVSWRDTTIHVVGLALDANDPALVAGLAGIREGRVARARRISDALAQVGFEGALERAAHFAGEGGLIGRTHFARVLVERKAAADVRGVFDHYLASGKPGYVAHQWAGLQEALAWIRGRVGSRCSLTPDAIGSAPARVPDCSANSRTAAARRSKSSPAATRRSTPGSSPASRAGSAFSARAGPTSMRRARAGARSAGWAHCPRTSFRSGRRSPEWPSTCPCTRCNRSRD